jgi:hypothetical protein
MKIVCVLFRFKMTQLTSHMHRTFLRLLGYKKTSKEFRRRLNNIFRPPCSGTIPCEHLTMVKDSLIIWLGHPNQNRRAHTKYSSCCCFVVLPILCSFWPRARGGRGSWKVIPPPPPPPPHVPSDQNVVWKASLSQNFLVFKNLWRILLQDTNRKSWTLWFS